MYLEIIDMTFDEGAQHLREEFKSGLDIAPLLLTRQPKLMEAIYWLCDNAKVEQDCELIDPDDFVVENLVGVLERLPSLALIYHNCNWSLFASALLAVVEPYTVALKEKYVAIVKAAETPTQEDKDSLQAITIILQAEAAIIQLAKIGYSYTSLIQIAGYVCDQLRNSTHFSSSGLRLSDSYLQTLDFFDKENK